MATGTRHPRSTIDRRTVTTRPVTFDHDALGDRRHYFAGDLLASHVVATLSGVIPVGERFVAGTVRRYRHRLEPPLAQQANGFIGQEHVHQREHERFNEALARLGYPTATIDRAGSIGFRLAAALPARLQVAMTAAIEHWTAVIAEHTLADDQLLRWDLPEPARAFLAWHLVEELEHRAVAFDAMQALGATELERFVAMRIVVALLAPPIVGGLALSLALDPSTWNRRSIGRSAGRARRSAFGRSSFLAHLASWYRPGFHPDERDIDDLLDRWRAELFGPEGLVTTNARRHRATPAS